MDSLRPTHASERVRILHRSQLRANMQIYKPATPLKLDPPEPFVVLETVGPVGSYNRANRSLTHFTENSIPVALFILLCGGVFPLPTLGSLPHCWPVFTLRRELPRPDRCNQPPR